MDEKKIMEISKMIFLYSFVLFFYFAALSS